MRRGVARDCNNSNVPEARWTACYLAVQMLGVVLLVAGFVLIHRDVARARMQVADELSDSLCVPS
jgi:hypothetical protein